MDYEWDEDKRRFNIGKHGVDFRIAALMFEEPVVTVPDNRHDYGEDRYLAIGYFDEECFVVVHTRRNETIRLISAWKGGRRDRRKYQEIYGR